MPARSKWIPRSLEDFAGLLVAIGFLGVVVAAFWAIWTVSGMIALVRVLLSSGLVIFIGCIVGIVSEELKP